MTSAGQERIASRVCLRSAVCVRAARRLGRQTFRSRTQAASSSASAAWRIMPAKLALWSAGCRRPAARRSRSYSVADQSAAPPTSDRADQPRSRAAPTTARPWAPTSLGGRQRSQQSGSAPVGPSTAVPQPSVSQYLPWFAAVRTPTESGWRAPLLSSGGPRGAGPLMFVKMHRSPPPTCNGATHFGYGKETIKSRCLAQQAELRWYCQSWYRFAHRQSRESTLCGETSAFGLAMRLTRHDRVVKRHRPSMVDKVVVIGVQAEIDLLRSR